MYAAKCILCLEKWHVVISWGRPMLFLCVVDLPGNDIPGLQSL